MYLRRFRLSLEKTKAYFDCVNCSCRNKMSYELARWRASNKFQGFLMVPDLRSCTMLSTLPLFYIAQSVNSDDRRARFQGLRVIMYNPAHIPTSSNIGTKRLRPILNSIIFFGQIILYIIIPFPLRPSAVLLACENSTGGYVLRRGTSVAWYLRPREVRDQERHKYHWPIAGAVIYQAITRWNHAW